LRWFFCFIFQVKFQPFKRIPAVIAIVVLALVCAVRLWQPDFCERLERMTYDLRVRTATHFPSSVVTNLAFVAMDDASISALNKGQFKKPDQKFGYRFGLYWPRQVYGRLVEELSAQGAQAVAFDVLFGELRPDHPPVQTADGLIESDDFFAMQSYRAGNVIIAATPDIMPPDLFVTNALAVGDISTEKDSDGILRRVKAFRIYRRWHPLFLQLASDPEIGADLDNAKILPGKIVVPFVGVTNTIEISVDAENNFQTVDFVGGKLAAHLPPKAKAFTDERVWHMGVVLAAQALKLDLAHAEVDLPHGKIILRGANGIERKIPVDKNGYFFVDWRLTAQDKRLFRAPIEDLLWQDRLRLAGETNEIHNDFRGKLVIVGSSAQGNDLTDRGATPLENDTLLISKHWNVANSIITGNFIRRADLPLELALILFLGLLTSLMTWQLRAFAASGGTILLIVGYIALAFFAFIEFRFWLPIIYPVLGAILVEHASLVTYRVVFEERDKRRVKSVFAKMISPDIVKELLGAKKLLLGGARRDVTIFFADVRGFTTLTDQIQEQIAEFVRINNLDKEAAEKCFEESAHETLEIVNLYLAAVAEAVKKNGGTLDKYIGDCVMAFWNAPTPNEKHAFHCVKAAIDAQRAIFELNQLRLEKNVAREQDNRTRVTAGQPPKPLHIALQLGTGINTGAVTVGLMGSDDHGFNYTVFGREVNLASRLEGVSGSGRIIISDTTYYELLRYAPELAATCVELFPVTVKGIKAAVRIYEVPWQQK
jgi:class 3 adenylate cyclase/CHASE2 domain-containing sensor protein